MKVRKGFVSNSSSSSFIIGAKPGEKLQVVVEIDPSKYAYSHKDGIKTIEELNKSCIVTDWLYHLEDGELEEKLKTSNMYSILIDAGEDHAADQYRKCKEAIEEGLAIFTCSFSDEDGDPVESLMRYASPSTLKQIADNGAKIISGEEW
jgi:hypothetical protein